MAHSLLDPDTLQQLFRYLARTDVDELELDFGTARLRVRRTPGHRTVVREVSQSEQEVPPAGIPIVSPLTGVYYSRPSPEEPAFVRPGDLIEPGQVVALIETMKLFNEVTAEIAGEVIEVNAQDGELVEAGSPLLHVRPREEEGKQ